MPFVQHLVHWILEAVVDWFAFGSVFVRFAVR